ncbi:MAG: glucosaminidase domain-containing protein [Psychromonas sp.]
MNKYLSRPSIALAIAATLLLTSCSETININSTTSNSEQLMAQPMAVNIGSLDDLNALFDKLQYSEETWNKAGNSIPRITFKSLSDNWAKNSNELPVETKKSTFFRLMTPLILISNENILRDRETVKSSALDSQELIDIAVKYKVISDAKTTITEEKRQTLLTRVDILPPSLALAQTTEESGWGTSRFASEGNAFFGQWDFSGNGMKPLQQRQELGNYGVARFDSPLASVEAYMLNLNTNKAYNKLRILRTEMHADNSAITGYELAGTLGRYSERGDDYIKGLRQIISFNKLEPIDEMQLSNNKLIHLISEVQ